MKDLLQVTESVSQEVQSGRLLTHFIWFHKPERLSEGELFAEDVYRDPARLLGSPQELQYTVEELPLYADYADINSCPI